MSISFQRWLTLFQVRKPLRGRKRKTFFLTMSLDYTTYPMMSPLIKVLNLSHTSGANFCRHSGLLHTYQQRITLKQMAKPRDSTKSSNNNSGVQSATNKKIGWISLPWQNLPTIIVCIPQLRFPHSLQIMVSTLVSAFHSCDFRQSVSRDVCPHFTRCPS